MIFKRYKVQKPQVGVDEIDLLGMWKTVPFPYFKHLILSTKCCQLLPSFI